MKDSMQSVLKTEEAQEAKPGHVPVCWVSLSEIRSHPLNDKIYRPAAEPALFALVEKGRDHEGLHAVRAEDRRSSRSQTRTCPGLLGFPFGNPFASPE